VVPLLRPEFDLERPSDHEQLATGSFDVVINAAAWTDVDGCAQDPARAMRINGVAPGLLAAAAARGGSLFVQVSTNEVFDGRQATPYQEGDAPNPINPYGASKLEGERGAASIGRSVILRTAWLFGPGGPNFVTKVLEAAERAARDGTALRLVNDEFGNPTWTPSLADALAEVAIEVLAGLRDPGIVHLAGQPPASRREWAEVALAAAGLEPPVESVPQSAFPRASAPPLHAVLAPTPGTARIEWMDPTMQLARAAAAVRR
jgi:dTDP-4-dehydrorhamnose reductase